MTAVANASGTVEAQGGYDAYGNATITGANTSYADVTQYTGRPLDEATGLQDNRGRWYDPTTGTFTVEDPTGFNAGDYNLMRYTGNDPTNGSDPSGLHPGWQGDRRGQWQRLNPRAATSRPGGSRAR